MGNRGDSSASKRLNADNEQVSSGNVWQIGAVEFDENAGCIRSGGASVVLDRNCIAILSVLLHANRAPVAKDRLLEVGWPDRVVHENSLAKAIGRLRKALGPEGKRVEAVYGKGYRLSVEAECVSALVAAPSSRPFRRLSLPLAGSVALIVSVIGLAIAVSGASPVATEKRLVIGEAPDVIGRVLWVDDHPENNTAEKRAFEDRRIAVYNAVSTEEALMLLSMYETYDAVISDMGRGDESLAGLKLVEEMRARGNDTPFFLYTILTSDAQRELLAQHGGQGAAETPEKLYGLVLPLIRRESIN